MSCLLTLAERCEAMTGYDRELDCDILAWRYRQQTGREVTWHDEDGEDLRRSGIYADKNGIQLDVPFFSVSLDAALTLVPAEHGIRMGVEVGGAAWAQVHTPRSLHCEEVRGAATLALALCAAALRARASQ